MRLRVERIDRVIDAKTSVGTLTRSTGRQASLQRALLEEEDRYGFRSWQVGLV
jgi:hypothetical protein